MDRTKKPNLTKDEKAAVIKAGRQTGEKKANRRHSSRIWKIKKLHFQSSDSGARATSCKETKEN